MSAAKPRRSKAPAPAELARLKAVQTERVRSLRTSMPDVARRVDERRAAALARFDTANLDTRAKLALMTKLAIELRPVLGAEGAELVGRVLRDARLIQASLPRHRSSTPAAERRRKRMRADYRRALEALGTVTKHASGESAWTLANHLRDAAEPLTTEHETAAEQREAEVLAIAYAREDARCRHLSDEETLGVLREFCLEEAANPTSAEGKRQRAAKVPTLTPQRKADLVASILGLSVNTGLTKTMRHAAAEREAHFRGVSRGNPSFPSSEPSAGDTLPACNDINSAGRSKG